MAEPVGLSGEQVSRLVLFRELEQLLDAGLTGEILLNCHQGDVISYKVNELRKPGQERRTLERQRRG